MTFSFPVSPLFSVYSHLVAQFEDVLELLAHAVVLCGEEERVEDDEDGDARLEEHVVHDGEEHVLEPHPRAVVHAELAAAGAVTVAARL